jgi:ATP-dependent DNA helicase DinG
LTVAKSFLGVSLSKLGESINKFRICFLIYEKSVSLFLKAGKYKLNSETLFKKISKNWSDFEPRQEQILMSKAVETSFAERENLFVEAGTGVGKSLAYLIPAAIHALKTGEKVVISTETIALQNQLISKDIPLLKEILEQDLVAEIAFGASNYVCKRKLNNVIQSGTFPIEMTKHLKDFYDWEKETESGIKSEYKGIATNDFWAAITRDADSCLGRKCPNFGVSYYFLEKEKWARANILIVNHHLLAANIASEFKILPEFSTLIIDEAHSFPDILGKSFGLETSYEEITRLLFYMNGSEKRPGYIHRLDKIKFKSEIISSIDTISKSMIVFFNKIFSEVPNAFQTARMMKKCKLDGGELEEMLSDLAVSLEKAKNSYSKDSEDIVEKEIYLDLENSIKKLTEHESILSQFRKNDDKNLVVWVEPPNQNKQEKFMKIFMEPLYPEKIVEEKMIPNLQNIVFTSATLSTGKNDFTYFKNKIGNLDTSEMILDSPFPYSKNCLLYLPKNIRDPKEFEEEYHDDISLLIPMLLDLTNGNTFVLFTSFKSLEKVYNAVAPNVSYPIFSQKELGAEKAKAEYLRTDNSVLFGVSTFWQGIDIKGDKLRSVIITKLPFQPPNEPVLEARMDELKKKNRNSFFEMQLPYAILTLKQGFGRLIRSKTDIGIVSLLDPRIQTKGYGKNVLDALPKAKRVFSLKDLKVEYKKLIP